MQYKEFLKTKQKNFLSSGFKVKDEDLNINLFDFQKHILKIALEKGRFAIFADCGLGKTLMQLSWSECIFKKTNKKVLILAPLAVVNQTKNEAIKFNINIDSFDNFRSSSFLLVRNFISLDFEANLFQGHIARQSSQPYILLPILLLYSSGI